LKEDFFVVFPIAGSSGNLEWPIAVLITIPKTPSMGTLGSLSTKKVLPAS
jgi:hypothetical protein